MVKIHTRTESKRKRKMIKYLITWENSIGILLSTEDTIWEPFEISIGLAMDKKVFIKVKSDIEPIHNNNWDE